MDRQEGERERKRQSERRMEEEKEGGDEKLPGENFPGSYDTLSWPSDHQYRLWVVQKLRVPALVH